MKGKWLLLTVFFLALLAPSLATDSLTLDVSAVDNSIAFNETARFVLTITNNQDHADRFLFSSTPSQLGAGTLWRFSPQVVDIAAHSSEDVIFDIIPPKDIRVGTYDLDIIVYSASDPNLRATNQVRFYITSEYPHLSASIDLPDQLYPGTIPVNIIVENTGVDTQENLTAVFESDLFGGYDIEIGTLRPDETRLVFNQDVDIPTSTEVGRYEVKLTFYKNGEYIDEVKKNIEVLGKGNLAISQDIRRGVLTTKYTITLTNVGNEIADEEWTVGVPSWKRFLVYASPKEERVDIAQGTANFVWPINLAPDESTTIYYEISYRPLLALILSLLLLAYVLAWYFRKEFSLSKSTARKKGYLEVKLTIKNNTSEVQHNVVVEDKIPAPLKLVREFGTKTPTAIKKEANAVKLIWKFRHLGPFEEVILTYGIKLRLSVVGLIMLPAAVLKAKVGKKLKKFYSNQASIRGKVSIKEKEEEA